MSVTHTFTDRSDGDLRIDGDPVELRRHRAAIVDGEWSWLHQVHGAAVVEVTGPGGGAGSQADALVTDVPGAVLSIQTADCAALLLEGDGAIGVVHAGWRGLLAGVVEATLAAMDGLGAPARRAVVGPTIRARCYEFSARDLDPLVQRYGPTVRAETAWGTTGLDLVAGLAAAVGARGLELSDAGLCTACSPRHWSHRRSADRQRQALVAWIEP